MHFRWEGSFPKILLVVPIRSSTLLLSRFKSLTLPALPGWFHFYISSANQTNIYLAFGGTTSSCWPKPDENQYGFTSRQRFYRIRILPIQTRSSPPLTCCLLDTQYKSYYPATLRKHPEVKKTHAIKYTPIQEPDYYTSCSSLLVEQV